MPLNSSLAVVIPVYNEAGSLEPLLRDWQPVLKATGASCRLIFIDDGSTDSSLALLEKMAANSRSAQAQAANDPALKVYTQPNSGHGPAILKGYRLAGDADWVFQLDSDHQLEPAAFEKLWANRDAYDLLLGQRRESHASTGRRLLSVVSGLAVRLLYGAGIKDANCPYRLMRGPLLQQALEKIPGDSFAPNILITSWFLLHKKRTFTTVVEHRTTDRRPSRMSGYILRGALRSFLQTLSFRFR